MTYVPAALRKLVHERAGGACEYCLLPEAATLFPHEVDHIIAEKHGGETTADNLALASARGPSGRSLADRGGEGDVCRGL